MKNILLRLLLLSFLVSCSTSKKMDVVDIELRDLDTLMVSAEKPAALKGPEDYRLPPYKASPTRKHDLLHTSLDLRFNWEKEQVLGIAELKLKPYFHPTNELVLDAKGFEIRSVEKNGAPIKYDYDGSLLILDLGGLVFPAEEFTVRIDYIASPAASGGSAAITSNQGLFFVNPRREEEGKPQQIWTQGETEWNSRWFPTIDKPNERCTQQIRLTVEDRFTTLSNGSLIAQTANDDGTRTDTWEMSQAHAPYLFMLAIGEFAVVREAWNGIPVEYYVEPAYEASAKAIFNHTPEMLQFFSDRLQYPYPWEKYAQVVVRDYVSGAMENTTAVIFGSFVQKHQREMIDNHNDGIVAHELFHHWFGDLVTCESWSNLTMNEGFANYSEYLWYEHKYGKDEAGYHLLGEQRGYLYSASRSAHPLIHFAVRDKEDMFDSHSYNKGGAVLHMLRNYVGDEAFWAALHVYLEENKYQAVEAHDLRLAFETVTGEDLNWFFNQWYFASGHPDLKVEYGYDEKKAEAFVRVEQRQDPQKMPAIFQAPLYIDLYFGSEKQREKVWLNQRLQEFRFAAEQAPDLINFDAEHVLLKEQQDNKTDEEYVFQFKHASHFYDRYLAMETLLEHDNESALKQIIAEGLEDKHWIIRQLTLDNIPESEMETYVSRVKYFATHDPHSRVRMASLRLLNEMNDPELASITETVIKKDSAYNVIGTAVELISYLDRDLAIQYVRALEDTDSEAIRLSIARIYAQAGAIDKLDFFERNLDKVDQYAAGNFYGQYLELVKQADLDQGLKAMQNLRAIAVDQQQSSWRRLAGTRIIVELANEWQSEANAAKGSAEKATLNKYVDQLQKMVEEINLKEENPQLKVYYQQMGTIERN